MKFFIKDFLSKCDQIRNKLVLNENFIFCISLVFCYKNLAKARRLKAILKFLREGVSYVLMDILLNS